ncbi:MAG: trypsin-like peptidase domain-containing protein [Muribaculaceae bacterium]|nr:trypsin-like peptidase domain-containing protein [Muribaculaceae bacterium]
MKKIILLFVIVVIISSCSRKGTPLTANEVETKFGSSIVLVKNEYYYSVDLGGLTIYFTGLDNEGDLENVETDLSEVKPIIGYGTGFFISEDGKIATNSHVVAPPVNDRAVRNNLNQLMSALIGAYSEEVNKLSDQINELHNYWLRTPSGSELEASIEMKRAEIKAERDEDQNILDKLRMINTSNVTISSHSSIGIAQNNMHITSTSDFSDCVVIKDDDEHDLAILQLKNKHLPEGCTFIDIEKYEEDHDNAPFNADGEYINIDEPGLGEPLYLLGYNLGPTLAITENGIKAQITEGSISQNTDDIKVMYSIPALHGSSGAPVVDRYGNLICINFAGLDMTQNFNYGIKAKHLRSLAK